MSIAFDRSICCDLNETISLEWLITNGLGGYASGTVAGVLTRMQHGLLVAPPRDTAAPQLLLAKIDEEVAFDQRTYYLGTNEYRDGTLNPSGFAHLETFRLEEGFPIFTYRLGGIDGVMLEKRIWMPHGQNTTYIQYRVVPTTTDLEPANGALDWSSIERTSNTSYAHSSSYPEAAQRVLTLTLLPFAAHRPYDQPQYGNNDWHFDVLPLEPADAQRSHESGVAGSHFKVQLLPTQQDHQPVGADLSSPPPFDRLTLPKGVAGCTIRAYEGAHPYHILAVGHPESTNTLLPTGVWYWKFLRRHDHAAGRAPTDDLYLPGVFRAKLWPGEDAALTIIVTAEELSSQLLSQSQLTTSYKRCVDDQRSVLQPQRYFGEGGETAHTHYTLPITTHAPSHEFRQDQGSAEWQSGSPVLPTLGAEAQRSGVQHQRSEAERLSMLPSYPAPIDRPDTLQSEEFLRLLLQAGERFLAERVLPKSAFTGSHPLFSSEVERIPVLISGYYGTQDCTRNTLIALPGLLLTTEHFDEARRILSTLARHFKQGLLPDRLPAPGASLDEGDYGSADTTLWYFYALDHYLRTTRDYELLDDLYHRLADSVAWHIHGTYNGIQVDAHDALLQAQAPGKALTWMNAIAHNTPVTPRHGKPVEINALWYHALSLMHEWSETLHHMGRINHTTVYYHQQSEQCKRSFQSRFWYPDGGYLYDVIDGPDGNDASLRPNQLLAISLRYPVLDKEQQSPVFDQVTTHLLTPYGLRTLAPQEAAYQGHVKENQEEQSATLHQGSAWPWLLGPYIDALLRVQGLTGNAPMHAGRAEGVHSEVIWRKSLQLLEPFCRHLSEDLLGNIASTFDGDEPHKPSYQGASALSVGEILRVYNLLARIGTRHSDLALRV